MTAIVASIGWLSGLFAAPALPRLDLAAAALLLVAFVGLGCLRPVGPAGALAAVALVGALLAVLRAQTAGGPAGPGSVLDYADLGLDVELRGRIVAEPERVDRGTRLRVAALEVRSAAMAGTTFGEIQALAPGEGWRYGDLVALTGRLERPLDRDDVPLADVFARRGLLASLRAGDARLLARQHPLARLGWRGGSLGPADAALARRGAPTASSLERDAPAASSLERDAPAASLVESDAPAGSLVGRDASAASRIGRDAPAGSPLEGDAPAAGPAATAMPLLDALRSALYDAKAAASGALDGRLPAPTAALARGLLLGGTAGMAPDLSEAFRRAGLTHVVAVSGYNITLVAAALAPLARLTASRLGGFALPGLAVLGFTLAVGAPASAVRAAIMGVLVLLARAAGRPPDAVAGLAIAALLMTLADPGLIHDLGFALSSLATLAIVAVYPWLDAHLPGPRATAPGLIVRATGGLDATDIRAREGSADASAAQQPPALGGWLLATARETLVATLAVELLAVPVIGATFGRVSVVSPVANLLVLPAVPLAMAASLAVALGGALPDWLVAPLAWAAWVPLAWIVAAVEACAGPAWASLPVGRLSSALVWAYYAAAATLLLTAHAGSYRLALPSPAALTRAAFDRLPAGLAIAAALLAALVAWGGAFSVPDRAPRLTFFEDSGATLLQTASGRAILIEPGPSGRAIAADLGRTLPFWSAAIDLLILPRGEAESLPELLRRYRVGQIVAPELAEETVDAEAVRPTGVRPPPGTPGRGAAYFAGPPPGGARWRDAAAAVGVPVASPPDGTSITLGDGAWLDLLQSARPDAPYAVHLVVGPHRVLVLGDASATAQRALVELVGAPVDILRLPADSAPLDPELRDRLAPRVAILHLRAGAPARSPPRPDERLAVLRSDDHGTVAVTLGPTALELRSRR